MFGLQFEAVAFLLPCTNCITFHTWNCLACQNVLNLAPRGLWQNLRMDLSSLRREFEISVEIMKYALIVWILPFGLLNCLNYADWRLWSLVSVWSCKVFGHACSRLKAYIFLNFTNTTWIQYIVSWTFLICNSSMWTFLGRFWLIVVNLLGISTRLQIKFRGNCRADLMASFRVGASRKQHRLDCYHFVCPAIVLHHLQWILP